MSDDEGVEADSPKEKYRRAKNLSGFNNDEAITILYDVYNDEEAEAGLRGKAICRAAILISGRQDLEQIQESMDLIIQCHQCEFITDRQLKETINGMIQNQLAERTMLEQLLMFACSKLARDQAGEIELFVDLKLRQAEQAIRYDDFPAAERFLTEAQDYCAIPPNPNNPDECRRALQILTVRIEFAERERNSKKVLDLGRDALAINQATSSERQQAILTHVAGLLSFDGRDFRDAGQKLMMAFNKFSNMGLSNYAQACLPYVGVTRMWQGDQTALFESPEAKPFQHSPVVAPVWQLHEAFCRADIRLFKSRTDAARLVFQDNPVIDELLNDIRSQVLKRAIVKAVGGWTRITIKALAASLESDPAEVRRLAYELMIAPGEERLKGLLDSTADAVVLTRPPEFPDFEHVPALASSLKAMGIARLKKQKMNALWTPLVLVGHDWKRP